MKPILKAARDNGWEIEDYDYSAFTITRDTKTIIVKFRRGKIVGAKYDRGPKLPTTVLGPRDIGKRETVLGWIV